MSSNNPNPISADISRSSYQFRVENSKTKNVGIGEFITTPVFSAGGLMCLIKYYPQGIDHENNGTYISLCLQLLTSSKSATLDYELGLLNKYSRPTKESWIRSANTFHIKRSSTYSRFMKRSDLESDYIRDDYFIIVCSITVTNEPCAMLKSSSIGVFPNNLAEELLALLERQEETDVTFELEGENISAHRIILASCSSVFKAKLFGPMVKTDCKCIKIDDMKPLVFRGMLHFIYTDSLPDIEDLVTEETSDKTMSSNILYQHLLVAANRYGLEGLKTLCEERLRRTISVDTVVSLLIVAWQHNWDFLKEGCLEFIDDSKNFRKVIARKEYFSLGDYPSILDDLRQKLLLLPAEEQE
ncbi:BTB/POZ/MATH-domain protein [Rhynchospora pubera]|uniref:BTB/POZ/MATH-domain protein n=1 Tax=Rhynchospora pubera TaxID=906938 RepID=A0AAV8GDC3_9POAL|nr:BTB/POZ/MATH-domain protein [Rhynchospora pubera]